MAWQDDGEREALEEAVRGSIAYYDVLPPHIEFDFGGLRYSAREMADSMRHFLALLAESSGQHQFNARFNAEFIVFRSVREDGENLFTGYYEPELRAAHQPTGQLNTPIYGLPDDLIKVRLSRFGKGLPSTTIVGRVVNNELHPYPTRAEIEAGKKLKQKARVLAYVDRVDLYFLQVQGSGVLRFADGQLLQVGYAASNGHPYRSLGRLMIHRNLLEREEVSLQKIRAWLADNPGEIDAMLRKNPSYVFFQEIEGGPYGNIRVGLTPLRSLAADHRLLPKGALAFVRTTLPPHPPGPAPQGEVNAEKAEDTATSEGTPFQRFMVIQDTGGAITGHGRGDIFFGAGEEAEWLAGHLKATGELYLFVSRKEFLGRRTSQR